MQNCFPGRASSSTMGKGGDQAEQPMRRVRAHLSLQLPNYTRSLQLPIEHIRPLQSPTLLRCRQPGLGGRELAHPENPRALCRSSSDIVLVVVVVAVVFAS